MKNRFYKVSRVLTALVLGAALLAVGNTSVKAASLLTDAGVRTIDDRTILENVDMASDISYQKTRSLHLAYGYTEVDKLDYHKAGLLGTTQCHHACPNVYLSVYLDQMDPKTGDIQNSVRSFDYEDQNVDYLTRSMSVFVDSGYYYSIRGYHSCLHDGVRETTTTISNWLYIGTTSKPVE